MLFTVNREAACGHPGDGIDGHGVVHRVVVVSLYRMNQRGGMNREVQWLSALFLLRDWMEKRWGGAVTIVLNARDAVRVITILPSFDARFPVFCPIEGIS